LTRAAGDLALSAALQQMAPLKSIDALAASVAAAHPMATAIRIDEQAANVAVVMIVEIFAI